GGLPKKPKKKKKEEAPPELSVQEEAVVQPINNEETSISLSKKQRVLHKLLIVVLFFGAIAAFIAVFTMKIYNSDKSAAVFNENAANVCSDLMSDVGTSKIEHLDSQQSADTWHILGISCVRRIDFNDDGKDELLVAYFQGGKYYVEVWGDNGKKFARLYKDEVNSLEKYPNLGSWLTIYHKSGKYYIGKLNDDQSMNLLKLKGHEFEKDEKCFFDPEESLYIMDDEINNSDFETIQFSALTSARADYYLNMVNDTLAQFIHKKDTNENRPKTNEENKASAYSKIIDDKISKLGEPQVAALGSSVYADGVAVVSLVDFNGDGNSELLIISRNKKDYDDTDACPKYLTEVFGWDGKLVKKFYEEETTSTYFDNSKTDIFYILQKKGKKTNLCWNKYSYGEDPDVSWTGLSTIVEMVDAENFEISQTAYKRKNYDYIGYKLNGEYTYERAFEEVGYVVPYFCNDDSKYDAKAFSVSLLKCNESKKTDIEKLIEQTEKVIKQINNGSAK
ncbi:MAG: hypothetical protein K2K01_06405, partial [Eubacterium sp.]|nr:hypothetical protein [Eubacterium sp.]